MITIDNKHSVRDIVYVKTDTEQKPHMVVAIIIFDKDLTYRCACGSLTQEYYDFELSTEVNVLQTL